MNQIVFLEEWQFLHGNQVALASIKEIQLTNAVGFLKWKSKEISYFLHELIYIRVIVH